MVTTLAASYLLFFCRISLALIFAISFAGKVLNFGKFEQTIGRFEILPKRLNGLSALLLLAGELSVVILLAVGGPLLAAGFAAAGFLLSIFSLALISILVRGIRTSCNCLGPSGKLVSIYDVWRNAGFLLCALAGWAATHTLNGAVINLSVVEWALLVSGATAFVTLSANLGQIIQLFRLS